MINTCLKEFALKINLKKLQRMTVHKTGKIMPGVGEKVRKRKRKRKKKEKEKGKEEKKEKKKERKRKRETRTVTERRELY